MVASPFEAWESFYVIVGSAAAVLTGLQFVTITLSVEAPIGSPGTISAFGTPTVVHFCAALFVSALLGAPWHGLTGAATGIGAAGLIGMGYTAVVSTRARRQSDYQPVLEDWVWHVILPMAAYLSWLVSSIVLTHAPDATLFVIGAAALSLLFIGIHNSWDAVTYLVTEKRRRDPNEDSID